MKYVASVYSAKGIREVNEDSFVISNFTNKQTCPFSEFTENGDDSKLVFFGVADGMGGQGSGDRASHIVVSEIVKLQEEISSLNEEILTEKINELHEKVVSLDSRMGSTFTALILNHGMNAYVNLGDSRIYRKRGDLFLQITTDDSLQKLISGAPKNIVTNGIGAGLNSISVNCRFSEKIVLIGDVFLLCSDGVYSFVSNSEIEHIMGHCADPKIIAETVVKTAFKNGSDDNCTAIAIIFEE